MESREKRKLISWRKKIFTNTSCGKVIVSVQDALDTEPTEACRLSGHVTVALG